MQKVADMSFFKVGHGVLRHDVCDAINDTGAISQYRLAETWLGVQHTMQSWPLLLTTVDAQLGKHNGMVATIRN